MTDVGESVTEWLRLWKEGDQQAIDRVTALVYNDLRRLAAYRLDRESHASTLQPTALVTVRRLSGRRKRARISFVAIVQSQVPKLAS
jgi:hypothetical protein